MGEPWWTSAAGLEGDIPEVGSACDSGSQVSGAGEVAPVVGLNGRVLKNGDTFGDWVVVGYDSAARGYLCQCRKCGKIRPIPAYNLRRGKSKSCVQCANAKRVAETAVFSRLGIPRDVCERLSNRFYAARSRCTDPTNPKFADYGGRGVQMRFSCAEDYITHLITLPGWDDKKMEADRINNEGHYAAGNLRFASRSMQNLNKRTTCLVEHQGVLYPAKVFHEKFAPKYRDLGTVARKIREGLSAEEIIADQAKCKGAYLRHT